MFNLSVHKVLYKWTAALLAFAFLLGVLGVRTAHAVSLGTVVAWGNTCCGQTNLPAGLSDVTAIAAGGFHSLALKSDGTIVAWGENFYGQRDVPAGLSDVTAISAGYAHNLALKSDGTIVAWGWNNYGQNDVPAGLSNVIAISAGYAHNLALKSDGTIVAWGDNRYGKSDVPAGLSDVTAISAGGFHSLALKSDGAVVTWGWNNYGQSDVPAGLSDVTAIAAGNIHSLALKSDGTVVGWGENSYGQSDVPAGLSGVTAIDAGDNHSLALKSDGKVVAWGFNCCGQTNVPAGLSGVTAIAAGSLHNLVLVSEAEDTTPPAITLNTPADGAQYLLGQIVNADYACQDEVDGSGLASCVGTVANSSPIDTASVGSKSFTVNATDNTGNPSSLTHNYSVVYSFSGFFQPVDNLPTLNLVKGGAGVAVKFSLSGNQGLNILATGYPVSQRIACDANVSLDEIEQTVSAGNSSLSFDPTTNTYSYTWKTDKTWTGTCRQLILKLSDGTEHLANFKFK